MIKDMTLGQYYPVDSPIHRLDPRTKLLGTLIYLIALFLADGVCAYLLAALWLLGLIRLSKVPLRYMLRGLKAILLLLALSLCFNIFFTPGETLWSFWILSVTREGLRQALKMGCRLLLLVLGSSLMTFTTTPTALTDGLEQGLHFLNKIKIPVHEMAMMMSIALRFLPILAEETDRIMKAQMARGADFESGNLISRAKSLVPVLVPLFVSAFRRAGDMALAMEARCYHGGEGRTRMKPLHYETRDYIALGLLALFLLLMILL